MTKRVDEQRRRFLKAMGLSAGGAAALSACGDTDIINMVAIEVRRELVEPNVDPQDFVQPGIGVYYASACEMCPAGCAIHARNREGRILKFEGNPSSPVNEGKLCPMGQAGPHLHYNPDRLTTPMARKGGKLVPISWAEAEDRLRAALGRKNPKLAWLTGVVSGHKRAIIEAHLDAAGSDQHYVFDPLAPEGLLAAHKAVFGAEQVRYRIDKAALVVSFGADFLGPWLHPVHFARQYARFREPPRGALVVVESKMTLTGANADRWIPVRPGGEAFLALALMKLLAADAERAARLPQAVREKLDAVSVEELAQAADVPVERVHQLRKALEERRPSLVLAGHTLEGQAAGIDAMQAVLALNVLLGNVGKTIEPVASTAFPALEAKVGGWRALKAFAEAVRAGRVDTLAIFGTNPVYHAPPSWGMDKLLAKVPTKVAFTMLLDETAAQCDLVLPIHSPWEEWGTVKGWYPAAEDVLVVQQPTMTPVFGDGTRAFGDLVLAAAQAMDPAFKRWGSFKDYVLDALWTMRGEIKDAPQPELPGQTPEEAFRQGVLGTGFVRLKTRPGASLKAQVPAFAWPEKPASGMKLVTTPRLGLLDGRHANVPWLQELPDQLTGVVWDAWAELHPKTAGKLGVRTGDVIVVSTGAGKVEIPVVVTPAIHPEAVAIPLGQGHKQLGRYANGRGTHPYRLVLAKGDAPVVQAVAAKVAKARDGGRSYTLKQGELVLESLQTTQLRRRIVRTVTAEDFHRFEKKKGA
ncbi:MAG: molybdopterin oxidoreductase [Zetaproteobacteria bacterium]|nr:MAG: molybdopterin oxidoreductase [Zetaproteobacteria bacterium]